MMPMLARRGAALAVMIVCGAGAALLRRSAERAAPLAVEMQLEIPAIPADVAGPLAFGFRSTLADFTFLEAIQLLALRKSGKLAAELMPLQRSMEHLLAYALEVDPKFAGAYRFAGTALPHPTVDGKALGVLPAIPLLEQGVRELPDEWRIGFLLGFLRAYYLGDYAGAAQAMAIAARAPGSPAYLGLLATRLAAQGGELQLATQLAEAMLAQANEDETQRQWEDRVKALHMERDLRAIEAAAQRWLADNGMPAPSVRALAAAGYLQPEPTEPHGGRYILDAGGRAHSSAAERLIVYGGTARLEVH